MRFAHAKTEDIIAEASLLVRRIQRFRLLIEDIEKLEAERLEFLDIIDDILADFGTLIKKIA